MLSSLRRSAKEHILGLSQVRSTGDDSVSEETIITEYALVINGHSLVRWILKCVAFSFVGKIILSTVVLVLNCY